MIQALAPRAVLTSSRLWLQDDTSNYVAAPRPLRLSLWENQKRLCLPAIVGRDQSLALDVALPNSPRIHRPCLLNISKHCVRAS